MSNLNEDNFQFAMDEAKPALEMLMSRSDDILDMDLSTLEHIRSRLDAISAVLHVEIASRSEQPTDFA